MTTQKPKPFVDPLVEVFDFQAEANGSNYEVRIGLPASYHHSDNRFPVLVVLDADIAFGTAYETSMLEAMWSKAPLGPETKAIPEFMVIGIALPDRFTNPFRRNFEYMAEGNPAEYSPDTTSYIERVKQMTGLEPRLGGAGTFQDILRQEILPLVAQNYRVDNSRRMLFGQSAGGAFCLYTLFTKPEMFTDFVIVSPGMIDQGAFRQEEAWAERNKDLNVRLLLSAGEREIQDPLGIVSNVTRLAEKLNTRRYPGLRLTTWIVPDASHVQTAAPSLARALRDCAS
jgi:predicted alpha/beta superfamily hydrolase